jgi:hypothetical protein
MLASHTTKTTLIVRLCELAVLVASLAWLPACRRGDSAATPVARPTVTLSRDSVALGSPLDIKYRFDVTNDATLDTDDMVMLHVVDVDNQLLWTDDHQPPIPIRQWKRGQTIEYTRTVFVPVYPYVGDASLQVGLYSPSTQRRLVLDGDDVAKRAYKAGRLRLLPQNAGTLVTFKSGWHPAESPKGNPMIEWHWTAKDAVLAFPNPKRNSTLFLDLDTPGLWKEPQEVHVSLGSAALDRFQLSPAQRILKRLPIKAVQLGSGQTAEIQITVDKTFVPATVTNGANRDPRELGVRVFHAAIEPNP